MSAVSAEKVGAGEWRVVPAEPTEEMMDAGNGSRHFRTVEENSRATYRAMLAAAPEPPASYPDRDALLGEVKAGQQHALERLRVRLEIRLNDHLCEMKPDYDDSITGFNEACVIMNKLFSDEIDRLRATQAKAGT